MYYGSYFSVDYVSLKNKTMKKFGLILGMTIIFTGFSFAQSGNDYKSRNHKLNKHEKHTKEDIKPLALKSSIEEVKLYNYKNRNHKFHNHEYENSLLIPKDKIVYDYKKFNHKFAKGQSDRFLNKMSKDNMLSDNK